MKTKKILVATGSRADYGLLYWVMKEIEASPGLELQVLVTGMHLSSEFGQTHKVVSQSFKIDKKVEMLIDSDSPMAVSKSMALGQLGCADALAELKPDLLVVLGDRYEILAVTLAATFLSVPIAHIAGGDVTEGAFDEGIRHSITKFSHLHFATNEIARQRIIQLGEDPTRVFNTGSPGIDYIRKAILLSKLEFEKEIGFKLMDRNLLVTFHPETLSDIATEDNFSEVLMAISELQATSKVGVIFTKTNSDTSGRKINEMIDQYCLKHENCCSHTSLGQERYLSALNLVDVVVGNSSSGLYEAPSFDTATVNIGDRQKGRLSARSVINCACKRSDIIAAVNQAMNLNIKDVENPYGDGKAAEKIIKVINSIDNFSTLRQKHFHNLKS